MTGNDTTDVGMLVNFAVAMLAVVNPVEKIPLWVAAVDDEKRQFQLFLAALVISSCALILLSFLWFGRELLSAIQVSLASFKIGGGMILLQFGFSMMKGTAVRVDASSDKKMVGLTDRVLKRYQQIFVPIGVPVIAGPGAITTVIIYGYQSSSPLSTGLMSLVICAVLFLLFLTLLSGGFIRRTVGILPLELVSRVFGMILIAIAVQFMVDGLAVVFPGWLN